MKWSRQTLFGLAFSLGGGIMLFALIQQINPEDTLSSPPPQAISTLSNNTASDSSVDAIEDTLTADVETEQRILAQKQKERMARVAEQEIRTKEFLAQQERAEALALQKARLESERYRSNNAIEPVPATAALEELEALSAEADNNNTDTSNSNPNSNEQNAQSNSTPKVTQPVVTKRPIIPVMIPGITSVQTPATTLSQTTKPPITESQATESQADTEQPINVASDTVTVQAPTQAFNYTVQPGDGLIKLSRRYNVPVQALTLANKSVNPSSLQVGQTLEIPSRKQVARLLREEQARNPSANNQNSSNQNSSNTVTNSTANNANTQQAAPPVGAPPARPTPYTVSRGDGLIKLARQYDMPVEALAQANNMGSNQNLQVGQRITIPSRAQISRLKREAEEQKRREQALVSANQRLTEARRKDDSENSGRYGVQVALADDQARADEVASKLRAAGYRVSTSPTNRGVRVIVGPETGKQAALALKDKINADSRTGVNGAWVLSWR